MADTTYILEYLFCCQFTTNDKIIDLLEDLATQRQKCSLSNKINSYGNDYYKLYIDVLKYFKIKKKDTPPFHHQETTSVEHSGLRPESDRKEHPASRVASGTSTVVERATKGSDSPSTWNPSEVGCFSESRHAFGVDRGQREQNDSNYYENSINNKNIIINWSSIRKKTLKDLVLKNYIIKVKYDFEFDENTTNNLKRDLIIGLNFKNVNDKNIIMKDNKILKIVGLNLALNAYSWDYDVFHLKSKRFD